MRRILCPLILLLLLAQPIVAPNVTQCIQKALASPDLYRDGWRSAAGGIETNASLVSGISLPVCEAVCGGPPQPSWNIFSQQFAAWLLPWLALISQLPFGASTRRENLMSMLLTIGSPTLALYSLAFTVLNGKYVSHRFKPFSFPNDYNVARILACLQQAPLRISRIPGLLDSLVALEINNEWFEKFKRAIEYEQNWGIPAITSIGWVVVAYILTVLDSFISFPEYTKSTGDLNDNGEAVGTVWLWLLPIVVGWLQLSPKFDYFKIREAFDTANESARVADGATNQLVFHGRHAFYLAEEPFGYEMDPHDPDWTQDQIFDEHVFGDEGNTTPLFNYSRILPWMEAVETVAEAFHYAKLNARAGTLVGSGERTGNLAQVIAYCTKRVIAPEQPEVTVTVEAAGPSSRGASPIPSPTPSPDALTPTHSRDNSERPLLADAIPMTPLGLNLARRKRISAWRAPGLFQNFFISSMIALAVQWGTTGSSVLIVFVTPNRGLGCRSLGYALFGSVSTLVWILMVISSVLAYSTSPLSVSRRFFAHLLRIVAKVLASINAVGIVGLCLAQFLSFFDNCYCDSSALSRKDPFFSTITPEATPALLATWAGALVMALVVVAAFYGFVALYVDHGDPDHP
ncbi:hypothetical protein C8J56DRAFT_171058 [Mycena floridula]|nr:hypothetical protein C8J56DRAFT_171058 [Mycena floridula]